MGTMVQPGQFFCGPLVLSLNAPRGALFDKFVATLGLYDVLWEPPRLAVQIDVVRSEALAPIAAGTYLECARMKVDAEPPGLRATCPSGVAACYDESKNSWAITAPAAFDVSAHPEDVEDLLSLVLTTGWRRAGWVPMHAAAIVNGSRCVFLCASSGGGKTSLAAALIRRQWQTLGDDKVLLRIGAGRTVELAALMHHFNLHPKAQEWFAEVGDLRRFPAYSAWTEKRRVQVEDIWPGKAAWRGRPTHLVSLAQREGGTGIKIMPLPRAEILATLLRQTVVPRDRKIAGEILSTVAAAARELEGLRVEIGAEAYRDPGGLEALERALH
jgi:hypothetical protein